MSAPGGGPPTGADGQGRACGECGVQLGGEQRYCLECGAREGPRDALLQGLIDHDAPAAAATAGAAAVVGTAAPPDAGPSAAAAQAWWRDLPVRVPSRPVSALLVAGFLGFGILLGSVAANRVPDTLAANSGLRLVVPAVPGAAGATSTGSTAGSEAEAEPPASEPEATPEAGSAAASGSPVTDSTAGTGTSSGSSGPSGEGEAGGSSGAGGGSGTSGGAGEGGATKLPKIGHVFVVMLANQPYAASFGPSSQARYLLNTLERRGELLVRYDAVAHEQLANSIALVSGQGPTPQIAANCPLFGDIAPGTGLAQGQVSGDGCVFGASVRTLADQLAAKHRTWRAYVEGLPGASAHDGACPLPASGQPDPTAAAGGAFATSQNPFFYFHSITGSATCAQANVPIERLRADFASASRTPSFAYIAPDRCHNGDPTPCSPGAPAGMGPADSFLARVAPSILAAPAFKKDGLLVITTDEAPSAGEFADSSACCGQPRFPNMPPGPSGPTPRGGGAVGALLLSPFVKGGTTSQEPFNHFSLLRSVEDAFGLAHLGYAGLAGVKPFGAALFALR